MNLAELQAALAGCQTKKNVQEIFQTYLASMGFSAYSFTFYNRHSNALHKLRYDFCSTRYALWHHHYLAENYQEIDSTLSFERKALLPVYWEIHQQLRSAKTERERQMRLDSLQFGAECGLSIPIHGYHEDFANLLVIQMQGENCLHNWQTIQFELMVAGKLLCHYLNQQPAETLARQPSYALTTREFDCLQLTSKQCQVNDIALQLGITPRTVNYHIQRMNKKLGVKHKYQAVTKAFAIGLLTE